MRYKIRRAAAIVTSLLLVSISEFSAESIQPPVALDATLITFDDQKAGTIIEDQYPGVSFPDRPRIVDVSQRWPGLSTVSTPNALEKVCSEFDPAPLTILFDSPQSRVRVYVGNPPGGLNTQLIVMRAYTTAKGGTPVAAASVTIAGVASIQTPLEVCRIFNRDIRRVEVEYVGQVCEVIDNLDFELVSIGEVTHYNFDDRPARARVTNQYPGVTFPDEPETVTEADIGIGVNSPPNALRKRLLAEFDPAPLQLVFNPPQGAVRVRVGNPPVDVPNLRVIMRAYNLTRGGEPTATADVTFNGHAPITTPLEVCRWTERDIRRVEIEFTDQYFEVIDDLEFAPNRPTPPPPDTESPRVLIDSPMNGAFFFPPEDPRLSRFVELRGRIIETRNVERAILTQEQLDGPGRFEDPSFGRFVTGSAPNFSFSGGAVALFPGRNRVRIEAIDAAGNRSTNPEGEIIVTLAEPMQIIIDSPSPDQIFSRSRITVRGRVRKQFGTLPRERLRLQVREVAGMRLTPLTAVDEVAGSAPEFRFQASIELFNQFIDTLNLITVEATSEDGSLARAAVNCFYSLPDVSVLGMEVTQAIQNASTILRGDGSGSVPLVASKRTVVRVYPQAARWRGGRGVTIRQVQLIGRRAGVDLPGSPLTRTVSLSVSPDESLETKRSDITKTWNWLLPDEWTQEGFLELIARVNSDRSLTECETCSGNNEFRRTGVRFQSVRNIGADLSFDIHPVILRFPNPDGTTSQAPTGAWFNTFVAMLKVYPVRNIGTFLPSTLDAPADGDILRALSRRFRARDNERVYGLQLPGSGGVASGRYATGPAADQSADVELFSQRALSWGAAFAAHELGHTFGLCHASDFHGECGGTGGDCSNGCTEFDWPYPHGGIGEVGLDTYRMELLTPGTGSDTHAHEFMSYGGNDRMDFPVEWVSPITWGRLFTLFRASSDDKASSSGTAQSSPSQPQLSWLISGAVDRQTEAVELLPIYRMEMTDDSDPLQQGAYTLELQDRSGAVLFSRPFDPVEPQDDPDANARFQQIIPFFEDATRLVIKRGTAIVTSRDASPSAPTVTLLLPRGGDRWDQGEQMIHWQASDPDGDPLSYAVQYSADGGKNWQTLAIDLVETQYSAIPEELPGSSSALVRVIASDGFNSATAALTDPLHVAGKAPQVFIVSPDDRAVWDLDQALILEGVASDYEDGFLADENLIWASDRDGILGKGRRVEIQKLSPGLHIVTLTATDRDGQEGQARITGRVLSQLAIDAAPGLEGSVDNTGQVDTKGAITVGNGPAAGQPSRERVIRGYLSFDLAKLPTDAEILAAQLETSQSEIVGDPYFKGLGSIVVDLVDYGSSLDPEDFDAPVIWENTGTLSDNGLLESKLLDVSPAVKAAIEKGLTLVQFRVRFAKELDGDPDVDVVQFPSSTSAEPERGPRLVISYAPKPKP